MKEAAPQTGYAPVNGLQMYYEIHGQRRSPLVLLHGAFATIDLWGPFLDTLAGPTRSSPSSSKVTATPPTSTVPSATSSWPMTSRP